MVIEKHGVGVVPAPPLVRDRDDLTGFGVVPKAGRVGHPDELVVHHRLGDFQRLWYDCTQQLRVGAVRDDKELPMKKAIRPHRVGRAD
ncbi:hypothetical protein D3C72_2135150 [compost metagenome]